MRLVCWWWFGFGIGCGRFRVGLLAYRGGSSGIGRRIRGARLAGAELTTRALSNSIMDVENPEYILPTKTEVEQHQIVGGIVSSAGGVGGGGGGGIAGDEHDDENGDQVQSIYIYIYIYTRWYMYIDIYMCGCVCMNVLQDTRKGLGWGMMRYLQQSIGTHPLAKDRARVNKCVNKKLCIYQFPLVNKRHDMIRYKSYWMENDAK